MLTLSLVYKNLHCLMPTYILIDILITLILYSKEQLGMSGRIKELSKRERGGILNEMKFATTNNRSEKICVKA